MLKLNSRVLMVFFHSPSELGPAEEAGIGATPSLEDHAAGDAAQGWSHFCRWGLIAAPGGFGSFPL